MDKLHLLRLRFPVIITYKHNLKWKGKHACSGLYEWDKHNRTHTITVEMGRSSVDTRNIIAHEYIHAWQCEQGLKLSHGLVFKWWAEFFNNNYGYSISKLQ